MPLSYSEYTADGATTQFAIGFDYLAETVVTGANPAGILVYLDEVKQVSGYSITDPNVVFDSAPASSTVVRVVRSTPRAKNARLVDFEDSTTLTSATLDTSALQLLFIAQEAFEQSDSGGGAIPTYLAFSESLDAYDAETEKISRVGSPTAGTDAVNKTYVDDGFLPYGGTVYDASRSGSNQKIDGVEDPQGDQQVATKKYVDDVATYGIAGVPQSFNFTGTGSTNSFTLSNAPYAEPEMLVVAIEGVLQVPVQDFTVTGGATNSELVIVGTAPPSGTVISVQNFGKARFLNAALLRDDTITTAMLQDNAVTTAKIANDNVTEGKILDGAVTTDKMPNQAVTSPKIQNFSVTEQKLATNAVSTDKVQSGTVDFARLKTTDFIGLANPSSTAHVLRINSGSANLTQDVLASADISDFNSAVTATRLSAFQAPTSPISMNGFNLTNVLDPTSAQHAATKAYVDANTQSAMRGTLISETTLGADSATWDIEGWFDDSTYLWYEIVCEGFRTTSSGRLIVAMVKNPAGTYQAINAYGASGSLVNNTGTPLGGGTVDMVCTPSMGNTASSMSNFSIKMLNNHSAASGTGRHLEVRGSCRGSAAAQNGWSVRFDGGSGHGSYDVAAMVDITTVQGLRFKSVNFVANNGSTSGSIRQGARVLVYGFEGLN